MGTVTDPRVMRSAKNLFIAVEIGHEKLQEYLAVEHMAPKLWTSCYVARQKVAMVKIETGGKLHAYQQHWLKTADRAANAQRKYLHDAVFLNQHLLASRQEYNREVYRTKLVLLLASRDHWRAMYNRRNLLTLKHLDTYGFNQDPDVF
jgi:hypothetical protein